VVHRLEFVAEPGCVPDVVCMVARELGSDRLIQLWRDDFKPDPPFDVGADALFVAYMASAEMGYFLQLGWPMPINVLDLYTEFRSETNGLTLPHGRGLLGALSRHALSSISKEEKRDMRDLVLAGGPWSEEQRREGHPRRPGSCRSVTRGRSAHRRPPPRRRTAGLRPK
jgi:DNA polymerase-1